MPGSIIRIFVDDQPAGIATVDSAGRFTATIRVSSGDGTHRLRIESETSVGPSASKVYTVVVQTPVVAGVFEGGSVVMGGTYTGTGPAGATLRIVDGANVLASSQISEQGVWQLRIAESAFRPGLCTVRMIAVSPSGIELASRSITFTVTMPAVLLPPGGGDLTRP